MEDDKLISRTIIGIVIILAAILIALLLRIYSGLIRADQKLTEATEKKTVKIWTIHGDIEKILNKVTKKYEMEHKNISFEIISFKNEDYQSTIENAAVTNELPDIFFTWGYGVLKQYVNLGLVWDITEAMRQDDLQKSILPGVMQGVTVNDKVYALPLYGWKSCLFYNKKLFDEYKIPYPKTYDEFIHAAEQFKKANITPIAGSGKEPWLASLYYMSLVLGEGEVQGVYDAAANRSKFNSEQFYNAAQKMQRLIEAEPWQKNYLESDSYDAAYLFTQGEAAMLLSGSWVSSLIESPDSKVRGKVEVSAFPSQSGLKGVGGYADTFVINKNSQITWDEELQKLYFDIMHDVAKSAVEEVGIGLPAYEKQHIDKEKFPTLYKCSQVNFIKGQHPAYDQILNKDVIKVYDESLLKLMLKEIDARQFIDNLSK